MDPRAGRTGEGLEAPTFLSLLLLQMRLHVHARLGASKNNQLGHRRRMTARRIFLFDLDQFWNCSRPAEQARGQSTILQKRRGPEGPFECYQRR